MASMPSKCKKGSAWCFRTSPVITRSIARRETFGIRNETENQQILVGAHSELFGTANSEVCLRRSARILNIMEHTVSTSESGNADPPDDERSSLSIDRVELSSSAELSILGQKLVDDEKSPSLPRRSSRISNRKENQRVPTSTDELASHGSSDDESSSRMCSASGNSICDLRVLVTRLGETCVENSHKSRSVPVKRRAVVDDLMYQFTNERMTNREWCYRDKSDAPKRRRTCCTRVPSRAEYSREVTNLKMYSVGERCHNINQFPPEVLCMIFMRLPLSERLNARRVCKRWLECSSSLVTTIVIRAKRARSTSKILKNSAFQKLNLILYAQFPLSAWSNIGSKIVDLTLGIRIVRRPIIRKMILHCENLRDLCLEVYLGNFGVVDWFIFDSLPQIKVVRPKLKNFRIFSPCWSDGKEEFSKWRRILKNLLRIYPNIVTLSVQVNITNVCSISRKQPFDAIPSTSWKMASFCAHMLSSVLWRRALPMLSQFELESFKLYRTNRMTYLSKDATALQKFFRVHKELKYVDISLGEKKEVWSKVDEKMLASVFRSIQTSCREIRCLNYCRDVCPSFRPLHMTNWCAGVYSPFSTWMYDPSLHDTFTLEKNWNYVRSNIYEMFRLGEQLKLSRSYELELRQHRCDKSGLLLAGIIPKYADVLFLTLDYPVSTVVFQGIFQHMTRLTTLKIVIDQFVREFAFTGRPSQAGEEAGFSINRLQNLERLEVGRFILYKGECHTNLCSEFKFLKLNYLRCWPPVQRRALKTVASNLPSLKTVYFDPSDIADNRHYQNFCRMSKNLCALHIHDSEFKVEEVKDLFKVCPSLTFLQTKSNVDYFRI